MKISEAQATTNFLRDIKENGGWGYKISDIGKTIKPFDFFYIDGKTGITYFVEAKLCKNRTLKFSQLRDNQWTALSRIHEIQKRTRGFETYAEPCVLCICDQTGETKLFHFNILLIELEKGNKSISF